MLLLHFLDTLVIFSQNNCHAHHHFEVNLVSWRSEISEVELTYDDTSNDMIIDGHTLPC